MIKETCSVLITGASSGIGRAISLRLLSSGFDVIATGRSKEKLMRLSSESRPIGGRIELFEMDVRSLRSVKNVRTQLKEMNIRVDALINNAGFGLWGSIFHINEEKIMEQFNTNLFGLMRVYRLFLEDMIENKSGKIINVGSVLGRFASPFNGSYVASKFALEGLSRCLRMELAPFGVSVSLVEPGLFDTNFKANQKVGSEVLSEKSPYKKIMEGYDERRSFFRKGTDPDIVARLVKKILLSSRPKARYSVGIDAKIALTLNSVLPNALFDYVIRKVRIGK